jgi:hypothetical protein
MNSNSFRLLALGTVTVFVLFACGTPAVPESPASTDITLENSVLENPDAGFLENVTIDDSADQTPLGSQAIVVTPYLPEFKLRFSVYGNQLWAEYFVLWKYPGSTTVSARVTVYTRSLPRTILKSELKTVTTYKNFLTGTLIGPFTARGADNCIEVRMFSSSGSPAPYNSYPRGKVYRYCPYERPTLPTFDKYWIDPKGVSTLNAPGCPGPRTIQTEFTLVLNDATAPDLLGKMTLGLVVAKPPPTAKIDFAASATAAGAITGTLKKPGVSLPFSGTVVNSAGVATQIKGSFVGPAGCVVNGTSIVGTMTTQFTLVPAAPF